MHDNKAIIAGLYDAFAAADIATVISAFAPDIHWTEADGFPYAGTYVGADAIVSGVFGRIASEWHGWTATANELVAEGDTVVAIGQYSGTCKATGRSFRAPLAHVWKLEAGLVKSFRQFTDTWLVRQAMLP